MNALLPHGAIGKAKGFLGKWIGLDQVDSGFDALSARVQHFTARLAASSWPSSFSRGQGQLGLLQL